jgi:hypothetical protein
MNASGCVIVLEHMNLSAPPESSLVPLQCGGVAVLCCVPPSLLTLAVDPDLERAPSFSHRCFTERHLTNSTTQPGTVAPTANLYPIA